MEKISLIFLRFAVMAVLSVISTPLEKNSNQSQLDYAAANQKLRMEMPKELLSSMNMFCIKSRDGNLYYNLGTPRDAKQTTQGSHRNEKSLILNPNMEDAFENSVVRKAIDPKFDPQSLRDAPKDPMDTTEVLLVISVELFHAGTPGLKCDVLLGNHTLSAIFVGERS